MTELEKRLRDVFPQEREMGTLRADGSVDESKPPHGRWAFEKGWHEGRAELKTHRVLCEICNDYLDDTHS